MSDKEKLNKIQKLLTDVTKDIKEAIENDCEFNLNGNGYNCHEGGQPILYLQKKINKIING